MTIQSYTATDINAVLTVSKSSHESPNVIFDVAPTVVYICQESDGIEDIIKNKASYKP